MFILQFCNYYNIVMQKCMMFLSCFWRFDLKHMERHIGKDLYGRYAKEISGRVCRLMTEGGCGLFVFASNGKRCTKGIRDTGSGKKNSFFHKMVIQ